MAELLTEDEARKLVDEYMASERPSSSTQEILNSGEIPRLKGYVVKPGKVTDSIFGGRGSFVIDRENFDRTMSFFVGTSFSGRSIPNRVGEKRKMLIKFENPPLETPDGIPLRKMVRTPRISTHDIERGEIPFKDQADAMIYNHMKAMLTHWIGSADLDVPGLGNRDIVIVAENLRQIPFENVLRGFMAKSSTSTSLYQHYMKGGRRFCGHDLPDDLFPNGPLPYVMDTPSTKSDERDESVSPETLFRRRLVTRRQHREIRNSTLAAYGAGYNYLLQRRIILVDTKFEHGLNRLGEIVAQDERLTPDSSRFWLQEDYEAQRAFYLAEDVEDLVAYLKRTQPGITEKTYVVNGRVIMCPRSYSKEFARDMSVGEEGYTDEQRAKIGVRYVMTAQLLTGQRFEPDMRPRDERVVKGLEAAVKLARAA